MGYNIEQLVTQNEAVQLSWHRFKQNRKRPWGLLGQDWGIHDLNTTTFGIVPKKITTIAALPGMGKTALIEAVMNGCDRWKENNQVQKPELCVFTWEMEASELIDRRISSKTGLTSKDLTVGAKLLSDSQIKMIEDTLSSIKENTTFYHQTSVDISNLIDIYQSFITHCSDLEKKDGIPRQPICIIDYVGLAKFEGAGVRTYGINDFYATLKQQANRTGGHFIILAQLDKSARKKDYPDLDDLADSQAIDRNSDNIFLLHRTEHLNSPSIIHPKTGETFDSKGKMIIRVPKGRQFGTNDLLINCDMSKYEFWGLNHHPDFKYWELYSDKEFWIDLILKKK